MSSLCGHQPCSCSGLVAAPTHDATSNGWQGDSGSYPLRRAIDTAATPASPCGLSVTDCLSPWVRTSRRAVKPAPATLAKISAPLARPEIFPAIPRVASAQEPDSEPPSEITLLLISSR